MKIFAELDENNIVVRVIKAEQSFINTLAGVWVEDTDEIKNTACIGSKYDEEKNAFILPCSSPSWLLNEETCLWEPPTPKTHDLAIWNESTQSWDAPE
jgi:hypothetical protein